MKESILDVLLYLFEHYFSEDADLIRDRDSLQNGLIQAGFSPAEINKAFDWLDALAEQEELDAMRPDLDGTQIMAILGIPPGPAVGKAYKFLLEKRLDEGPLGPEAAEQALRAWWAAQEEG